MKAILIAVAIVAMTALSSLAAEQGCFEPTKSRPAAMNQMQRHPQHLLAMAHHKNIITFGHALAKAARQGETVPHDFARSAIAEMRRSTEEMEKYRAECKRTMPAGTEQMQKMMDEHLVNVKTQLRELEEVAKKDVVPSQEVLKHLQFISDSGRPPGVPICGHDMPCMQNNGMEDCRCGKRNPMVNDRHQIMMRQMMQTMKANDADLAARVETLKGVPKDKKVEVLSDIVSRMVQQRADLTAHMEKMQRQMMHGGGGLCIHRQGTLMAPPPMMRGMEGSNDEDEDTDDSDDTDSEGL